MVHELRARRREASVTRELARIADWQATTGRSYARHRRSWLLAIRRVFRRP